MGKRLLIGLFLAMMLVFGATTPYVSAQGDDLVLYGIIGQYLVTVDRTGDATEVAELSGDPVDSVGAIAFDWNTDTLYGLARTGEEDYVPNLVTIDRCTGEVAIIGTITLPGETVSFAEGLAINPEGTIYVSMSLNGGPADKPPDYWSETLATVDPNTAVATLVATITNIPDRVDTEAEADGLEFVGNTLYAVDYAQSTSYVYTTNSTGVVTFKGTLAGFNNVGDMAYNPYSGLLYGFDPGARHLCTISQPGTATVNDIGETHDPNKFGGKLMSGLAWAGPCKPFVYSVKFLCGEIRSEELGLRPAKYATAINIHNFHDGTVVLKKKIVIANREGTPVGTVSQYTKLTLGPNEAVEIDCVDICGLLGLSCYEHVPSWWWWRHTTLFVKGFVVIESNQPLNIVAVYTSSGDGGFSMDIEYISPVVSP